MAWDWLTKAMHRGRRSATTKTDADSASAGDDDARWRDLMSSALDAAHAGQWDLFTDTQRLMGRQLIADGRDGEALGQMLWVCFLEMHTAPGLTQQSEAVWQVDRLSRRLGVDRDRLQLRFIAECEGRRPAILPASADDAWPTLAAALDGLETTG